MDTETERQAVSTNQRQLEQRHFTEKVGQLFGEVGLPPMAGRILGWLLISDPPHQSPAELAEVLQASKGSISTMTQLLTHVGLIERISLPGERRDYFRIKLNAWAELSRRRMAQVTAFREIADRGLELMADSDAALRQRLEEMRDMHAFFEQEIPGMIDRWERQRQQKQILAQTQAAARKLQAQTQQQS